MPPTGQCGSKLTRSSIGGSGATQCAAVRKTRGAISTPRAAWLQAGKIGIEVGDEHARVGVSVAVGPASGDRLRRRRGGENDSDPHENGAVPGDAHCVPVMKVGPNQDAPTSRPMETASARRRRGAPCRA
jgi:hypothetical protein